MLYDFHKYQNNLKPASVHATYLVYGSKPTVKAGADGDVEMMSSAPEQDYLTDAVPCTTMTLVAEDKLQDILSEYADVTSLHVYSLSPQPQKDLTMLSDVAQSMSEYPALDDAAAQAKKYGGIVNPHLRKRTRKNAPPPPTPAAAPSKPIKTEAPKSTAPVATKVKTEPAPSQSKDAAPSQSSKPAVAPKKAAGGIMQSFAKAAAKPPKPKPVKKEEDTTMALSDDGEADDEDMPVPANKKSDAEIEASRQARKNREDELRRMMEEDEDEEEEKEDEDEEMEEPEPEPEAEPAAPVKEEKEPQEVVSSAGDGRRRGKRRVMKKKRILDDQGYMGKYTVLLYIHTLQLTLFNSDNPRRRLGVLFRRRSAGEKGTSTNIYTSFISSQEQKATCLVQGQPRQHHVLLWQEIETHKTTHRIAAIESKSILYS